MASTEVQVHDGPRGLEFSGGDGVGSAVALGGDQRAVAAVAREEAEIKAAVFLAKQFPRNEPEAFRKIIRSLDRPTLADDATYSYPRGGSTVTGPSVYLARELARLWGNMRHGVRILSVDEDFVHIRGWALDVETNSYTEAEDRFRRLVQRKRNGNTEWVEPDERDLRELVNKRGAILIRNCILELIPSDIVEEAVLHAAQTLRKKASGELKEGREDTVRRIVITFDALGITTAALEAKLGHPIAALTPEELTEFRQIIKSIRDGQTKPADHFDLGAKGGSLAQRVKEEAQKIQEEEPKKEEPKKEEPKKEEPKKEEAPAQEQPKVGPVEEATDRLFKIVDEIDPAGGDAPATVRKKITGELEKSPLEAESPLAERIRALAQDENLGKAQANAIYTRLRMLTAVAAEQEQEQPAQDLFEE